MPLAGGFLGRKTFEDLGAIMNGIGLLDEEVVCSWDNWAVGIRARDGRRGRQAVN